MKHPHAGRANFIGWHKYGGQRREGVIGFINIVEADNRHLFRDLDVSLMQNVKGGTDLEDFDFDDYDEDEPDEGDGLSDEEQEDEEA